jgi:hypothetical protein
MFHFNRNTSNERGSDFLQSKQKYMLSTLCATTIYLFIYSLFYDPFSVTENIASNDTVISEWWIGKKIGRKRSWPNFKDYSSIRLEGLRKTKKSLSYDSRSPGRYLNPVPHEYEAGVLTTRYRASNYMVISERWIGKDLEESGRRLILSFFQHSPGGTKENQEKP